MILILSTSHDEHALRVMSELSNFGAHVELLDLSEFPQRLALNMRFADSKRRFTFGCEDSGLDLGECGAVWWRRPQNPEISPDVLRSSHRMFALNESLEALQGLWQGVSATWVNDPVRDQASQHKAYQLCVAQDLGLRIPETLITNCPTTVEAFASRYQKRGVIYKAFSATSQEWRETRLLRDEERALLDSVRYTPVIFQEYIEAEVDLRVTIIGEHVFAASIHSQETAYPVDFRMDMAHARLEPAELPPAIEERLLRLMRALGLVYGAIDMRRMPNGEHVFLEINPAGQWLFVEDVTGQPISRCLAEQLLAGDRAVAGHV